MLLILYGQWEELGPEWNVDGELTKRFILIRGSLLCVTGLGWKREVREDVLRSAKLLHWNGKGVCVLMK